jgi:hypothetical protein
VFLSRVLTATFRFNRRRTLPLDFGHHGMKSAVTMSCLGLLVECMQNPRGRLAVTWMASKPIVEDSLDIAQSLAKQLDDGQPERPAAAAA